MLKNLGTLIMIILGNISTKIFEYIRKNMMKAISDIVEDMVQMIFQNQNCLESEPF